MITAVTLSPDNILIIDTTNTFFALSPSGNISIYGIDDGSGGGTIGRIITIFCNGSGTMTFYNIYPTTSLDKQLLFSPFINLPTNTIEVRYGSTISFVYVLAPPVSTTAGGSKWVMISHT